MARILLIDDDAKLISLLEDYLKPFGFEVTGAGDGPAGLEAVAAAGPDLVILDVMLPGWDGFEVCRRLRAISTVPIIMLSARGEAVDRIVGLELGADDYLPKPFEPRELVSRIQSVLRRARPQGTSGRREFDGLSLSPAAREAYAADGRPLGLSSMEFELLALLSGEPGRKFSRDEILNRLQGTGAEAYSRSVDILVSRLRAKLGDDPKAPRFIKSSRGWGYVFLGRETP
jgi:DNA-binding response OmpR family regulator